MARSTPDFPDFPDLPKMPKMPGAVDRRRVALAVAGVVAAIVFVVFAFSGFGVASMGPGQVGVVRNGGPLDDKDIRQILQPAQSLTWTGWLSSEPHAYPSASVQRFYTVTSNREAGNRSGVDVVQVPTRDGVQVGIEATLFFNFVGESNEQLLRRFDTVFGTRTFPVRERPGERLSPWEGDDGFAAMLDTVLRPVIDNDLRQEVGQFRCAQLVSSCALVAQGQRAGAGTPSEEDSNANLQEIQEKINVSLAEDIERTLGAAYFPNIRFNLSRVTLPTNVQTAIDQAQSAFADVSKSRARVRQAEFQNQANRLLAKTYQQSPELAQIEAIKSIPEGAEVIFNVGGQSGPGLNVGRR